MTAPIDTLSAAPPDGTFAAFDFAPGRIYALGLTYADHIRETGEKPSGPVVFLKQCGLLPSAQSSVATLPSSEIAATIQRVEPELADWLATQFDALPAFFDYEVEIGIALYDDVTPAQLDNPSFAPRYGLFLANDLTTRTVQIAGEGSLRKYDFWSASKSFPEFLPTGEKLWLPATPQLDTLPTLNIETRVNGEVRQSASTSLLIYTPRQMLRFAAQAAPNGKLHAHDLILTGTPAGVALSVPAWKRRIASLLPRRMRIRAAIRSNLSNPKFLKPGDTLSFSAAWLGSRTLTIT